MEDPPGLQQWVACFPWTPVGHSNYEQREGGGGGEVYVYTNKGLLYAGQM